MRGAGAEQENVPMLAKIALLIMRIGTGMLLVLWGGVRLLEDGMGAKLAEKYYGGVGADSTLQMGFAGFEVAVGALVVLGLLRRFALPLSALILVGGAIPIWRHFLDPFGQYLFDSPDQANLLFFPSLTVAGASLALIALRDMDTLALDRVIGKKGR
jgi:putative oxidoreductase